MQNIGLSSQKSFQGGFSAAINLRTPQQLFQTPTSQAALPVDAFQKVSAYLKTSPQVAATFQFVELSAPVTSPVEFTAAPELKQVEQGEALLVAGQRGEAVRTLQNLLTAAGYPLTEDGDFGTVTEGKLKHFQKDHGITVNGQLGRTTLAALRTAASESVQPTAAGRKLVQKSKQVVREMGTVGWCYTGVARSVARAFGVQLYGASAYMADSQLRRSSAFKEVKNADVQDLQDMPAGTVVVWDRAPARSGNRGRGGGWDHGHIAVLDGKGGEYSDHYRAQMFAPHYAGGGIRGVFVPV